MPICTHNNNKKTFPERFLALDFTPSTRVFPDRQGFWPTQRFQRKVVSGLLAVCTQIFLVTTDRFAPGLGLELGFVVAWKAPSVSDDASSIVIFLLEALVPERVWAGIGSIRLSDEREDGGG